MDPSNSREGNIQTVRFNGTNFNVWKFSLFIRLREHGLVSIVDGSRAILQEIREGLIISNQAAIDQWKKDENLATHYLFNTCNEEQQQSLLTCESAHAIWTSVTNQFQQGAIERRQSLQQEFLNYKFKPEHDVRAHVEAIKLIAKQCVDAGGQCDDETKCNRIVTSLPPSNFHFVTTWENTFMAERTLVKLTRRLCRLEDRFKSLNGGQRSHDDQAFFGETNGSQQLPTPPTTQSRDQQRYCPYPLTEREVFGGGNRNPRFATSNQGNGTTRRYGRCWYCNYFGHGEKECRFKRDEDAQENLASTSSDRTAPPDPKMTSQSL